MYFFSKKVNNIIMKKLYKIKLNKKIITSLIIFSILSILSIYSAGNLIGNKELYIKQLIWFIIGIFIIYLLLKIKLNNIYKHYKMLYLIGNILLILLLLFATPINNSKCWFNLFGIITIQPSEFMKIILIIVNAMVLYENNNKKDYVIVLKIFIITLIPSILTFLEPDTGMVIIYFVISFTMLFTSKINKNWFIFLLLFLLLFISIFLSIYFYYSELFIKIFGTNFFYRIDRLLDWKNGSGMQITNALTGIGSAGLFGFGFNNTIIYFPEAQTDFIFSVFTINFGLIGATILLLVITYFDLEIIKLAKKEKNIKNKYVIIGILGMLFYQQIQNIGMNLGLLPITGITLPFISYGGSSLISYMIAIGIILNISKKKV